MESVLDMLRGARLKHLTTVKNETEELLKGAGLGHLLEAEDILLPEMPEEEDK